MPEQKLLLQLQGEAHKSKQLPLLQAGSTIPLTLPDRNQNKAAQLGGGMEVRGQVDIYAPGSDWSGGRSRAKEGPNTSLIVVSLILSGQSNAYTEYATSLIGLSLAPGRFLGWLLHLTGFAYGKIKTNTKFVLFGC